MSIEITVPDNKKDKIILLDPVEIYGAEHGKVFQQYCHGHPQKHYSISAGGCEPVIDLWYDDESKKYRLSSSDKEHLRGFLPHVKYKQIDAHITITLDIK